MGASALLLALALAHETDLSALNRFPPPEVVDANLAFAREHVEWLQGQCILGGYVSETHGTWLREAERIANAWEALRDAQRHYRFVWKRQSLERLRHILGERDYANGRMPPCAPLWRFVRN